MLCQPAFLLVVRLRKSLQGWVNPLSAAQRGRTRVPDPVTTQAPRFLGWQRDPRQPPTARAYQRQCPRRSGRLLGQPAGQLLDHQDAPQVTRASTAWPLRLGWKKSRLLTWLALNW